MSHPDDGTFYVTATLLGGHDTNSRTIRRWGDDRPILTLNANHKPWTHDDDRLLSELIDRLNGKWKADKK